MEAQTKKTILIWIAATAGVMCLAGILWYLSYIGQFSTYLDKAYNLSVKFPRHWQLVMHPQPGGSVVFISPKENPLDTFQENVNITVQEVPLEQSTLKSLTEQITLQMTKVFNNIKLEESLSIMIGDRKAQRILFSVEKPDAINILSVVMVKVDKAYILTYMSAAKKYKMYLPLVERMIKSFRLTSA